MPVTYSVEATVFRSTRFARNEYRKLGLTSGSDANEEFSFSVDLTMEEEDLPELPIVVVPANITKVRFVIIQVTGGTATIKLSKDIIVDDEPAVDDIEINVDSTIIMSGIDLNQISITAAVSKCFVEIYGIGE